MGINPLLYALCQNIFDFGHLFFLHLKKMKVSTLEGDFTNSPCYLCVYILFGTHNKTDYSETPQWRKCLRRVQVSCWFWQTCCTSRGAIVWLIFKRPEKEPFSSPGYWEFHFKFFTWNKFVGMNKSSDLHHTFNVCCRTRCSVHDTTHLPSTVTKPVQCQQVVYSTVPVLLDYKWANILSMGGIGFPYHSSFPGHNFKPESSFAKSWVCCVLKPRCVCYCIRLHRKNAALQ